MNIKIKIFIPIFCAIFSPLNAQVDITTIDFSKIDTNYLSKVDISQIPDESVLRAQGIAEEQIRKLMEYKRRRIEMLKITPPQVKKDTIFKTEKLEEVTLLKKELLPPGKIFGQDMFRNNNIMLYEKAADIKAPDNYVLGPGDEVNISVWGYSDYSETFRINDAGYISPKYVGRVYLKGLTFANAKSLLHKKFGNIFDLQNSKIDITLTYSRVVNVNIIGEVFRTGSYKIPAINTAFNALVAANGPTDIGSIRSIYIKRNGKIVDSLDVYKFLMQTDYNPEIYLENNDYIFVPVAKRAVKITNCIRRPHTYELKPNENLMSVIDYAGGLTASAYTKNIQIKRYIDKKEVIIDVNLDSLIKNNKDFPLYDGDEITIPKIPEGIYNFVSITGAVRLPGKYELKQGSRISDLLKQADGLLFDAYLDKAYLIRTNKDYTKTYVPINLKDIVNTADTNPFNENSPYNLTLQEFDSLHIFSKTEFADYYKIPIYGEVRKPGEYEYGENLSLKDALFLAGGIKPEAEASRIEISRIISYDTINNQIIPIRAVVKTFKINKDLTLSDEADKFLLQPYDQVFVRTNPDFESVRNVVLLGEVKYPGTYLLLSEIERIESLIKRAGGLTEYAFVKGATLWRTYDNKGFVYLNLRKSLDRPQSKYNIILKDQDTINIPRIHDLVYINGAIGNVNYKKINVPYFSGKRAKFYIKNFAGGFAYNADKSEISVTSADGIFKKTKDFGIFRIYPKVQTTESVISVPEKPEKEKKEKEREPFDWNKFLENTTVKITAILTIWLLIENLSRF